MVKEKLAAIGKPLRKFASTPNLAATVWIYLFSLNLLFALLCILSVIGVQLTLRLVFGRKRAPGVWTLRKVYSNQHAPKRGKSFNTSPLHLYGAWVWLNWVFVPSLTYRCFFRLLFLPSQSSDLSFGFVGSNRLDSPENNKLWRNRVSFLLKVTVLSKYVVLQKIHFPPSFCLMSQKFRCPRTRKVNKLSNMVERDYQLFSI